MNNKEDRLAQLRTDISTQHYIVNRARLNIQKLTEQYTAILLMTEEEWNEECIKQEEEDKAFYRLLGLEM